MTFSLPERIRPSSLPDAIVPLLAVTFGLTASYLLGSPLGWLLPAIPLLAWFILRSPVVSIISFIVTNAIITLRPRDDLGPAASAPGPIDVILGLILVAIMAYWFLRIRVYEFMPLGSSIGQLLLVLFLAWGGCVTLVALAGGSVNTAIALRELLNIMPAAFFPIFYERYVEPDSREENLIFITVALASVVFLIGNVLAMKANLAKAFYLYQIGRGRLDVTFLPFPILLIVSAMMTVRRRAVWLGLIPMLALALVTLVISMSRNLYLATPLASLLILWMGTGRERLRAIPRLLLGVACLVIGLIPIYLKSKLMRLLVTHYFVRFLSAGAGRSDRSFNERLNEWSALWTEIKHSPVVGHGFGAIYKYFDPVRHYHLWQEFSHSSYLYIVFKTGWIGAILFFVGFALLSMKGIRLLRHDSLNERQRIIVRTCCGFLVIMLFSAYLGPVFDSKTDMTWLGLVWGYFLALEKRLQVNQVSARGAMAT